MIPGGLRIAPATLAKAPLFRVVTLANHTIRAPSLRLVRSVPGITVATTDAPTSPGTMTA